MTFRVHSATSRAEELARSTSLVSSARAHGAAVDLIVPNHNWSIERKLLLAQDATLGVTVQTYAHYLEGRWELFGDGRTLITPQQRKLMLRPLLDSVGLLEAESSSQLVDMAASFMAEAIAPGLCASSALTQAESTIMELVSLYEHELELKGFVEPAQAAAALDTSQFASRVVIVEEPSRSSVHEWRFYAQLGQHASVDVFQLGLPSGEPLSDDEPRHVRARLYTGQGGLAASGHVLIAEARGAHADGYMVARVIEQLQERGVDTRDICVVMRDTQDASPRLLDALVRADIPFETGMSVPLARTGLGNALCELASFARGLDDESTYDDISDVLVGPYSGLKRADARALQGRWRSLGGSTAQQRLHDIQEGYVSGQANRAIVQERLQPLRDVLAADDETRVRMLFENAKRGGAGVDALLDDRAAAHAALDFLQDAATLGTGWSVDDLANVSVTLERSFGDAQHAVRIVSAGALALQHVPWVVMTDMDAQHYPMACRPDVFDGLRHKLGIGLEDTTALEQRLLLGNMLELCDDGIALCRCLTDAQGDELCQSALWDETMMVYRAACDEASGLAAHAVPAALESYALRTSEADAFMDGEEVTCPAIVYRGKLRHESSIATLPARTDGTSREFSPTQLEDYHRCPYLWFTSRRIGYNALDRTLDSSALGTLFHDTMARFYPMFQKLGHARVTPENVDEATACVKQAFRDQLVESEHHPNKGLLLRTHADKLQVDDIETCAVEFVKRDATFLPGFTPTYFEVGLASREHTLEYATVPVRGAVDRIDVDECGRAVIVDYKLSKLRSGYGLKKDSGPDGINQHVQTDIYARLVEKHFAMQGVSLRVVGSVYRSYSENILRGVYEAGLNFGEDEVTRPSCDALPKAGMPETYAGYLDRVERTIRAEVERLAAGDITPRPIDKSACEFCKAASFCPRKGGTHGSH